MQQQPSEAFPATEPPPPWPPAPDEMEPIIPGGEPRGSRWLTVLAWLLIILVVMGRFALVALVEDDTSGDDPVGLMIMRIQGRYLVGASESTGGGQMLYGQSKAFNTGTVGQRLRFAVLAAELAGPEEARKVLDDLAGMIHHEEQQTAYGAQPFEVREEDAEAMELLGRLYPEPGGVDPLAGAAKIDTEALSEAQRDRLVESLGWFGELALAPPGTADAAARKAVLAPARRTFAAVIGAFIAAATAGVLGFIALVVMFVLALLRYVRSGIAPAGAHHGIYAETFALWLVVFFILQLGAEVIGLLVPELVMLAALIGFFLSLLVLGWPVLRGIPWGQVRADIGWTAGRTRSAGAPLLEGLIGLGCYAMTLPILAIGLLITLVLITLNQMLAGSQPVFAPAGGPAHPIIAELGDGNVLVIVQILLLGCIAAPIVEETMFRGVLYRHLRGASAAFGVVVSVVLSTALTGFVFAAIHPQGWVAIPALMGLATGFALAREWRGTLIPAMVMHGLSNGLVLGMLAFVAAR
jgi:membrane protease YdiL (CAAX protease family)